MGQRGADRSPFRLLTTALRTGVDGLLAVVLAPACVCCDEPLEHASRGPVCALCWSRIAFITPPICEQCGDPLPSWRTSSIECRVCPRCRRGTRFVDRAQSVGHYDGTLRAIVHALKYEGRRSLAVPLGRLMRERGADILAGVDGVVPVPLHRSRKRQRGFNQAMDLARALDRPVVDALRRVRATATQTDLPAAQRHRNVRAAFAGTSAARSLVGAAVLLVDDVTTTGATLDACARALKEVGVREVRALTVARVVAPPRA